MELFYTSGDSSIEDRTVDRLTICQKENISVHLFCFIIDYQL